MVNDQLKGTVAIITDKLSVIMKSILCNAMIFVAILMAANLSYAQTSTSTIELEHPEARPVANILKACKTSDIDLFRRSFSEEVQRRLETSNMTWKQFFTMYQEITEKELNDFRMQDLSFSFEGKAGKGVVVTHYKDKTLPGLKVIKEDGEWKLNEN